VEQFQPANDTKKILLDESDPSKFVIIGTGLSTKWESKLTSFLRENWDIFAWSPKDMPGMPRELAEHSLHVRPDAKPVKQPLQRFAEEKRKAIGEEIARLLAAGFIMEVFYPDWLANPVLVLKKNNTWRMCIDYTSLNKAFPKDSFALPHIDQVIDSTAGCDLLSFLDTYSGYH
jgi:putative transposase